LTTSSSFQYLEFRGLTLNGNNLVGSGFKCQWGHHMRFIGNTIKNMGSAGISAKDCDYLTSDGNTIYHSGYNQGDSSGITYNSAQFFDHYTGFHNYVLNNIISGEYDATAHTDGSGIIMDLSNGTFLYSSANTPPALILNNVIYENGGGCFESYVSTDNCWINNTCYKNTLDTAARVAEAVLNNANRIWFINNIVYAVGSTHYAYAKFNSSASITWANNLYFNSQGLNFTPPAGSNFISANPLILNPPPAAPGGYSTALDPTQLSTALTLQAGSQAIDAGIDPLSLAGLDSNIRNDLTAHVYADINGRARPQGAAFDLGAYEMLFAPAAPTNLSATAISTSQINLAWTDNSSTEDGFKIEQSTDNVSFTQIATVGANVTTYSNSGLNASTTYYYRVRATSTLSGDSNYSNTTQATTAAFLIAPSNLTATAASSTEIDLSWTDNSNNEDGFKIEQSTDNVNFTQIAMVAANVTTYASTGLTAVTTYYFRVRAASAANGDSAYSNVANATTNPAPVAPAAPTGLTANAVSTR